MGIVEMRWNNMAEKILLDTSSFEIYESGSHIFIHYPTLTDMFNKKLSAVFY